MVNIGYDLDDQYSEISDPRQQQPTNRQSWNPENSKDTYAKISQQLDQGNSYQVIHVSHVVRQ
jgi:protein tyrosine/serine phosphatase